MTRSSPGDQQRGALPGVRREDDFEILAEKGLYSDRFMGLSVLDCRLPGGGENQHLRISLPPVVAVVALLPGTGAESPKVVLVEQLRPAVGGVLYEIAAGHIVEGESPGQAAARDLEEETGFRAGALEPLAVRYTLPGMSPQPMHFFMATDLEAGEQQLDESECIVVHEVELDLLVEEILSGPAGAQRVVDNKTHLALLHVAMLNSRVGTAAAGGLS
ncbi:MAG: NUDIX hydrolase [Planctomycetota bacterium]|nr:NUDIX hydrolase [Planctomycetota bacterium]